MRNLQKIYNQLRRRLEKRVEGRKRKAQESRTDERIQDGKMHLLTTYLTFITFGS